MVKKSLPHITLDTTDNTLLVNGQVTHVWPKAFQVALALAYSEKPIVSREDILGKVYGDPDSEPESNVVKILIHHLRNKIGKDTLKTHFGLGWEIGNPEDWQIINYRQSQAHVMSTCVANIKGNCTTQFGEILYSTGVLKSFDEKRIQRLTKLETSIIELLASHRGMDFSTEKIEEKTRTLDHAKQRSNSIVTQIVGKINMKAKTVSETALILNNWGKGYHIPAENSHESNKPSSALLPTSDHSRGL